MAKPAPRPAEVSDPDSRLEELRAQLHKKDDQISSLTSYMGELKRELKHLEWRVSSQDRTIERLRNKGIDEARKNKEVTIRDSEIGRLRKDVSELKKRNSELQSNLDRLKQIRALELRGDRSPVKIIESISKDAIAACDHRFGIKAGDIIFARDAGGGVEAASILIERGVKAVIIGTPMSHLAEEKFLASRLPVLKREDVPLKFVDGYAVLDPVTAGCRHREMAGLCGRPGEAA